MQISKAMTDLMNAQVGYELGASNEYLQIATWFDSQSLKKLAGLFYQQSDEERTHALKFVHYLIDVGAAVQVPAIAAPAYTLDSAEAALKMSVDWEQRVTRLIYDMVDLAVKEKDYASQAFLQWFVSEQVEEVSSMETLLSVVQRSGEKNLLMTEAYIVHSGK